MNTPSRTPRHKRIVVISGIIVLIIAIIVVWWLALDGRNQAPVSEVDKSSAELSGAAKQAEKESQKEEKTPTDRPQAPAPAKEGAKASITPIITGFNRSADGAQLMVDGGVNEIVEKGGTCRFVVSWPGGGVSQQTEGINAPSSTSCKTARFAMDQLPTGANMTIQLTYSSAAYQGTSTNGPSITKEQIR